MKKKEIIMLLLLWILLMIPSVFIIKNSAVRINDVNDFQSEGSYTAEDIANSNGYEISGNEFKTSGYDPGFYIENVNQETAAVRLRFAEPLSSNMEFQLFYKTADAELSEEYSVKKFLYKGNQSVVINIPKDTYGTLRFDIEGSFSLDSVDLSSEPMQLKYQGKTDVSIAAYIIAGVFILLILWFFIYVLKIQDKAAYRIKQIKNGESAFFKSRRSIILGLVYLGLVLFFLIVYKAGKTEIIANRYVLVLVLALVSIIYYVILNIKNMKDRIPAVVFVIILLAGFCYTVTLPVATNVSTDDETHYRKAVCLSHIFDGYVTEADEAMYMKRILPDYSLQNLMQDNTELQRLYRDGQTVEINVVPSEIYISLSYIPSAMGLLIGRGIGASFAQTFLLGRYMNVLVYAVVMYFALKKLKSGRLILAIIALLPTNIFMASSYGYDAWLTCFSALAIAYIISIIQDENHRISKKEIAVIMLAFIFAFAPKAVYFPLFGLCFLVPVRHFADKKEHKKYIICTVVCALIVLSTFLLPFVIGGPGSGDARGGAEVNSAGQVRFILQNPVQYTKILLNHMKEYLSVERQGKLIASMMHMGDSSYFVLIYLTLTAAIFSDRDKKDDSANNIAAKIWTLVVTLASVVLVSTALYVSFTAVGSSVISGCQYRYLMPLLYPVCYFVFNIKMTNRSNMNFMYTIGIAIMFMVLLSSANENWIGLYVK